MVATVSIGDPGTSAWANAVKDALNGYVAYGTYTPTLVNYTLGTGGTINEARYLWVGGNAVGNKGLLTIQGQIKFGTSGMATAASATISVPSGFKFVPQTLVHRTRSTGFCHLVDVSTPANNRNGVVVPNIDGLTVSLFCNIAAQLAQVALGGPFTWAASDEIHWSIAGVPAERV